MDRLGWEQRVGRGAAMMQGALASSRGRGGGGDGFFVPVISKTDYIFDGRGSGVTQSITLAAGIDTVAWVSGVLVVRIHAKNTWSSTAILSVIVENMSLVPEDPSVLFVSSTPQANLDFQETFSAPTMKVMTLASGIAGMLQVRLKWAQGATPMTLTNFQSVSISVDLIGRPA